MKAKLVGVMESQGVFEGKPYHKVKLQCITPYIGKGKGWCVIDEKSTSIKYDDLAFIFNRPIRMEEIETYVGGEIDLEFNQYKQIVRVSFPSDNYVPEDKKK